MPPELTFSWDAAAVSVALCALALTILSHCATVRHHKLSVRPLLTTTTDYNTQTSPQGSACAVKIALANVGLGAAVIQRADLLLDGRVIAVKKPGDVGVHVARVFPNIQMGPHISRHKLNKGHALAAGATVGLVRFSVVDPPPDLEQELERFSVLVHYKSMYGDLDVYDSRKHRAAA